MYKLLALKLSPEIQQDKRNSSLLQFRTDGKMLVKFVLHPFLFIYLFTGCGWVKRYFLLLAWKLQ